MTNEERKVIELALEALETPWNAPYVDGCDLALGKRVKAITAIKEALAQTQEPLTENGMYRLGYHNGYGFGEAYGKANPPQRTWVGLTNDEINNLAAGCHLGNSVQDAIYKAVAKLKDKNHA